jgi:hypothetical protein
MRRNYISPEFKYNKVLGTYNMVENPSLFGSKVLEVEDKITIDSNFIQWYQRSSGEQIDQNSEINFGVSTLDVVNLKKVNSTLELDKSISESTRDQNPRWILTINLKNILSEYLFATLKNWRTFEGVENYMTLNNNVDVSIREYINQNVLNRFSLDRVELFLINEDFVKNGGLKYQNTFDQNVNQPFTKFESETDPNQTDVVIKFYQGSSALKSNLRYYYNIYYSKT